MNFKTSVAYHDAFLEVELVLPYDFETKHEAERVGNGPLFTSSKLHLNKMVIGKGTNQFTIAKEDTKLYQFRVCRLSAEELEKKVYMLAPEDYENITWDEAVAYIYETYEHASLPFTLESYYYAIYENEVVLA